MPYQEEVDRNIPGETWAERFARIEDAYDAQFGDEGFIYAIQTPEPAIKIGRSKDPKRLRLQDAQSFFCASLKLLAMWETEEMHASEKKAHQLCEHLHLRGEMFKNEPEQIISVISEEFGEPV